MIERKYPSQECQCLHCSKRFNSRPGTPAESQKYCSHVCYCAHRKAQPELHRRNQVALMCAVCSQEFWRRPNRIRTEGAQYCSPGCFRMANSPLLQEFPDLLKSSDWKHKTCDHCGNGFEITKLRELVSRRYCDPLCSRRAHAAKVAGTLNPNYRHGRNRVTAKKMALNAHAAKCMICEWDIAVDIHHIEPYRDGINNRLDNLIVLCPNHHRMADMGLIGKNELKEILNKFLPRTNS